HPCLSPLSLPDALPISYCMARSASPARDDLAQLDRAPPRVRVALGDRARRLGRGHTHQRVAADDLLRLRERALGHERAPAARLRSEETRLNSSHVKNSY